jgi:hypothetical protein
MLRPSPPVRPAPLPLRLVHVGLAAALVAALLVRVLALGRPLWLDEGASWWFAKLPWAALWGWLPTHENHSPLYYSLVRLVMGVSASEAWLRLPSLVAALAAIALTASAARHLVRTRATRVAVFYAAALAATMPLAVRHAYDARPYALELAGAALLTLGALRALSPTALDYRQPCDGVALSALIIGGLLTAWAQYVGLLTVASVYAATFAGALFLIPRELRRGATIRLLGAGVAIALGCLPLVAAVLHRHGVISTDFWTGRLTGGAVFAAVDILAEPAFLELGDRLTHLLSLGCLAVAAVGAVLLWRRPARRPAALVLAASLVLPFLGLLAASLGPVSLLIPRSLIAVLVPLALLQTVTLVELAPLPGALVAALLVAVGLAGAVKDATEEMREDWPALVHALRARSDAQTIVVFELEDTLTVASYYLHGELPARAVYRVRPGIVTPVPAEFGTQALLVPSTVLTEAAMPAAFATASHVLVVLRGTGAAERDSPLKRTLAGHLAPIDYVRGGRQLTLVEWAARPAVAIVPH